MKVTCLDIATTPWRWDCGDITPFDLEQEYAKIRRHDIEREKELRIANLYLRTTIDICLRKAEKNFRIADILRRKEERQLVAPPVKPIRLERDSIKVFEEQKRFFMKNLEALLAEGYGGKFVAVLNNRIVDSDADKIELAKRVYGKYGYVPLYIGKVQRELRVVEIPSPERR